MDISEWKSSQPKRWFVWKPIVLKHTNTEQDTRRPHLDDGYIMKKQTVKRTGALCQRDNRTMMIMKDLVNATKRIEGSNSKYNTKDRIRHKVKHHLKAKKFSSTIGKF